MLYFGADGGFRRVKIDSFCWRSSADYRGVWVALKSRVNSEVHLDPHRVRVALCFLFLQPASALLSLDTQELSLHFNLHHSSCALAKLSPFHTVDLYSLLFDLHFAALHLA